MEGSAHSAKSIRLGDPMAPIMMWAYALFLLLLLAGAGMGAVAIIGQLVQGNPFDGGAAGVVAGFLFVIALASIPFFRVWHKVYRLKIERDGTWSLGNVLGFKHTLLAPELSRAVQVNSYKSTSYHAGGQIADTRTRAAVRIVLDDGRSFVGHTNLGPNFLARLGYDLAGGHLQQRENGLLEVPFHTFSDGSITFQD